MTSIIRADNISTVAGTGTIAVQAGNTLDASAGFTAPAGHVIQAKRFEAPVTEASVTNFGNGATQPTTSNTQSLWTAAFTPVSSSSKILGIYQSQEDGQGTGGWTVHTCFVGNTLLGSSMRYLRYSNEEPYTQSYTFEYDHNSSSAITFDMRYGSTASIYIRLNRSNTNATNGPLAGATSLMLMEIAG